MQLMGNDRPNDVVVVPLSQLQARADVELPGQALSSPLLLLRALHSLLLGHHAIQQHQPHDLADQLRMRAAKALSSMMLQRPDHLALCVSDGSCKRKTCWFAKILTEYILDLYGSFSL